MSETSASDSTWTPVLAVIADDNSTLLLNAQGRAINRFASVGRFEAIDAAIDVAGYRRTAKWQANEQGNLSAPLAPKKATAKGAS